MDPLAEKLVGVLDAAARELGDQEPGAALRLARRFGIGGYVARHTGVASAGSAAGERLLRGIAEDILVEAGVELSAAFARREIPHFFLKGVALCGRVYERGDRAMSDIDVQVAPSARERAVHAVLDLGYRVLSEREQDGPAALRPGLVAERGVGSSRIEHVAVDLGWGVEPVERLLRRPDHPVPHMLWDHVDTSGRIPVPSDAHHIPLVVHHLVHHDMLHVRGLLDIALLWRRLGADAGPSVEEPARQLGVLRVTRLLCGLLVRELGLQALSMGPAPRGWRARQARKLLTLRAWGTWAGSASSTEQAAITPRRVFRRMLLVDCVRAAPLLLADAIAPPREYLSWRWPEAGSWAAAEARHLARVMGKLRSG